MRLLSYNIHKGIGGRDRRYDLDRVVRVIEDENPDLICLQEVTSHARRCHYHNQPRLLARHFSVAASCFQMNVHYRVGGYGNLILSRWPFSGRHHISLRHGRRKPRGAQLVVVQTPEGPLHLAHGHLGLAADERLWQVVHLLRHHLFREAEGLPTLVVGDFNDWRNALAELAFKEHGFEMLTSPPSRFRTFPAFLPVLALDKAFHRGVIVHQVKVTRTPLTKRASDHLPLVVDFHLTDDGLGK
ncbi:MAG TPA: endonuclease/exonuclease/phosphatase family protein [Fimbriiglobus sp.]|nr:endonuclease/exonuclease/phosphatase family protein [Fimbriiglobus sp.]